MLSGIKMRGSSTAVARLRESSTTISLPSGIASLRNVSRVVKELPAASSDGVHNVRMAEARRSFLIQEPATSDPSYLYSYCRKFGPIARAFTFNSNISRCTLLEYNNENSINQFLPATRHFKNDRRLETESRLIYFCPNEKHRRDEAMIFAKEESQHRSFFGRFGNCPLSDVDLQNCDSLTAQITTLHKKLAASELDVRLRFFHSSEVERFIRRLLPTAEVRLFGSSVSGLGRYDSDIDMVLNVNGSREQMEKGRRNEHSVYFLTKMRREDDRVFAQQLLSAVSGILSELMPQVFDVRRILKARVPIIKFSNTSTGIDCDLCLDNKNAVDMSRLISCLCECDSRFAPLVFVVRHWARVNGVTKTNPGPWFSNFMLTLLVVFYLQVKPSPILPSLDNLCIESRSEGSSVQLSPDVRLPSTSDNIHRITGVADSLDVLLIDFFLFYSTFDFATLGLSLVKGSTMDKPEALAPVHLENPLDHVLNVCKNVNIESVAQFQDMCRAAAACLAASRLCDASASNDLWGLLTILQNSSAVLEQEDKVRHIAVPSERSDSFVNDDVDIVEDETVLNNNDEIKDSGKSRLPRIRLQELLRDDDELTAVVAGGRKKL